MATEDEKVYGGARGGGKTPPPPSVASQLRERADREEMLGRGGAWLRDLAGYIEELVDWARVEDGLPDVSKWVSVWYGDVDPPFASVGWYSTTGSTEDGDDGGWCRLDPNKLRVTHWRPLPEGPTDG